MKISELEEMEFRNKLGQRIPKWRIIFAPLCWVIRLHFWRSIAGFPEDGGCVDTARCKLCGVFYHMWW